MVDSTRDEMSEELDHEYADGGLEAGELRFRGIMERLGMLAVQVDASGTIVFANESAERLVGRRAVGLAFTDLLTGGAREQAMCEFQERAAGRLDSGCLDLPVVGADGTVHMIRWNLANLQGPDGEFIGVVSVGEDVTERAAFERQIAQKAEEFDAIFRLSRDLFFRLSPDGVIVGYNAPAVELLYVTPETFMNRPLADVLPADVVAVLQKGAAECRMSGEVVTAEYRLSLGGRDLDWEARFLPLEGGDTAVIVREVTESKRRLEQLNESRDFSDRLLELLDSGVLVVEATPDRAIVRANRIAETLLGYGPGEMLGMSTRRLHASQEAFEQFNVRVDQALGPGELRTAEAPLVRKDGTVIDAEISVRVLSEAGGLRLGVFRDISDRKAAEQMIRESEARLRAIVDAAPFGMHFYRLEGDQLIYAGFNPAAIQLLGMDLEQFLGLPLEDAFPSAVERGLPAIYRHIAEEGGSWRSEQLLYDDGEIVGAYDVTAFQVQPGRVAVAFTDVTDRKTSELRERRYLQRLSALAAELANAEDAERRRLAENLHDRVGQTLAVAMMHLRAAEPSSDGECSVAELAEGRQLLENAIQETRTITTELFPPVLQELGLGAALRWLCEETERDHGLPCTVRIDGTAAKGLGLECRNAMFRSARELLVNCVKHAHAQRATVSLSAVGSVAELVVEDDGVGFDVEQVTAGGSPGFGLFSIRERVPHIGGEFEIHSGPGEGARAVVRFPLAAE